MKRLILILGVVLYSAIGFADDRCNPVGVHDDVQSSLWGGVEISTLHIGWSSARESDDLDHYEVWRRLGGVAVQVKRVEPHGDCAHWVSYDVEVDYEPQWVYYVEVHDRGGSVYRGAAVNLR